MKGLEGGGVVSLRGFVTNVIGSLRTIGSSREAGRREREGDDGEGGGGGEDEGDEMDL
jgi:hypothetical protein